MTDLQTIIGRCRDMGISLGIGDTGVLTVAPWSKATEELRTLLKANKPELLEYIKGNMIPCQARIPVICAGSHAPTTMVQPKRFGESLSGKHQAALCGPCLRQIQRRDKSQSIQTENDFLWAVLRTETIRGLYERS